MWGRKPILLGFMTLFAIGSFISGSAGTMNILIVGRALQGAGGCGALAVTEIIYADMVPLPQRGIMQGMQAMYVEASTLLHIRNILPTVVVEPGLLQCRFK
jgi:MFS family permease